jgi:hypothetical protein
VIQSRVEQDFAAAQTGRGAFLLEPERASRLLVHVKTTDWYIRSIETFELDAEGPQTLNLAWSMPGLRDEEVNSRSPDSLNEIADRIFERCEKLGLRVLFNVWVAPRKEFGTLPP